jgi:hypothetical protein
MKNEAKYDMSGSKLSDKEIKAYFKKNPKAADNKWVYRAVIIALNHGGAMTYAVKEIDKLKKGLHKSPEVKKALRWANESTHSEGIAREKYRAILKENYTKNFELLCQSLKFNPIQQRILDQFIHQGQINKQYVGRVAGTAKKSRIYAGTKKFMGSIENRKEALMKALKVNGKQKNILDQYLKTGKVVGKYAGSIAGSIKSTKSYAGFRGFKEHFESVDEGYASNDPKVKAIAKKFKKDIKDIRRGYMYLEIGDKLYEAVYSYLSNSERGKWDDPDFAFEKVSEFIHDESKFGLGKVK